MSPPVLVFLPGLLADARLFLPQLVRLGADYPCLVALPTAGETVEQMSEAILSGLPERFVLVGQGLGGAVALDILRRAPGRPERLVLIATDPMPEPPQTAAEREMRLVAARAGRLQDAVGAEFPPESLADNPWRDEVLALVRDMALGLGEGVYLRQSRALQRRPDQQKTLRNVKIPALVVAGAHDAIVPLRRQQFTAGLMPFGQLHLVEGAGHFPTLEEPEAVSEAIAAFLSGPVLLR